MSSTAGLELLIQLNDKASKGLDAIGQKGGMLQQAFSFAMGGLIEKGIEGIAGAVGDLFRNGVDQVNQWDDAMAQVDAHLKSTGGSAGVTRDQVMALANSLSAGNGMSRAADDAIASGEAMLLTFTNIGKDTFPAATQAMLDMATAMNGGAAPSAEQLSGEAIKLGKALNDPTKGLTALSKVGVAFTAEQKEQIKTLQASGNVLGAQKIILGELSKEFGGSAAASAKTFAGSLDVLREKFNNVAQTMGQTLMPMLQQVVGALTSPEVMGAVTSLMDGIASGITQAVPVIVQAFQQLVPLVTSVFTNLWATISPVIQQLGGLFMQILPAAINMLVGIFNGVLMPVFQAVATFILGTVVPAISGLVNWLSGFLPTAVSIVSSLVQNLLLPILQTIGTIIFTDVIPAFEQVASWLGQVLPPIISGLAYIWQALQPILLAVASLIFTVVVPALLAIGTQIMTYVAPVLQFIGDVLVSLVSAWTNNWMGIRTVVEAAAQVIWFNIQLAWGVIKAFADAIGWLLKPVADTFHLLAQQAGQDGKDTGNNYTGNMTSALNNGIPGINANINGIGSNLGALQAPSSTYGWNIGGNWIGGINSSIANGMTVLNANITAINSALATMGMLAEGQTVPGYGFGPSVGIDKNGNPTGAMTAAETQADYAKRTTAYLQGQLKAAQQGIEDAKADMRENNVHASLGSAASGLNLFGGFTGSGGLPSTGGTPSTGGGGGGGGSGKSAVQDAISAAADMTSKISQAVSAGVAALGQLSNFVLPAGFAQGVENFAQGVDTVMMRMQEVALKFKDDMLAHTTIFLDTAQKAMGLVSAGVDALAKLKDFAKPTDDSMNAFTDAVEYMIARLGDIAAKWSIDALSILGLFADSTGKAMAMVSTAIDSLGKLKDFQKPSDLAMQSFVDALDYITDKMRRVIAKWDQASLTLAANFGDSVNKMITGLGAAVDVLTKLVEFKRPTDDAINAFFDALDAVIPKISDRSRQWYGLINENISKLAGFVGTAVNGMLGAVDGFIKLGADGVKMPTQAAMDAFFTALDLLVPQITDRTRQWYGLMNETISVTADAIGKAVSGLLGAVDGFTKLASGDAKAPSADQVGAFFDALDLIVPMISDRARQWYGLVNESTSKLAGWVGTTVSGIAAAIDPLIKLATFVSPPKEAVDAFFASLVDFIQRFGAKAAEFEGQASPIMADLAARVGGIVESIGKAIDPLLHLADAQKVTPEQIEGAFANIWRMLNQFQIVMAGMPADFVTKAQAFAGVVSTIFSAIKSGFDVASTIAGDSGSGGSIGQGFSDALTKAQELMNYLTGDATAGIGTFTTTANTLKDTWVSDMGSMANAAEDFARRAILAFQSLPGGTTGTNTKTGDNWPPFELPHFARGGIVTRPTLAWVGDGGEPEAIIPFSQLAGAGGGGGGGVSIGDIIVYAGLGADGQRIGSAVLDQIENRLGARVRNNKLSAPKI